jgi:hypothetical protein
MRHGGSNNRFVAFEKSGHRIDVAEKEGAGAQIISRLSHVIELVNANCVGTGAH